MTEKRIICPQLQRKVPKQFSWVDQRLVRDGHIRGLSHQARSLYLFLVTVSDADGLSYYSDKVTQRQLGMAGEELNAARQELKSANLIAYRRPLYQVLSLGGPILPRESHARGNDMGEAVSIREVFAQIAGGAQ